MQLVFITALFFCTTVHSYPHASNEKDMLHSVKKYMDDAVERMKMQVLKATQQYEHKHRAKRSLLYVLTNSSTLQGSELHLNTISAIQALPTSYPLDLEPFVINDKLYMAVINYKDSHGKLATNSFIFRMNDTTGMFEKVLTIPTIGGTDFEFVDYGMEKYMIFVGKDTADWIGGQNIEKVLFSGLPLKQNIIRIMSKGARRIKCYTSHYRKYFITASYYDTHLMYGTQSTLRIKNNLGYQLIQEFPTFGAEDVETFVINGERFIAFANSINNAQEVDIYSTIYKAKALLKHEKEDKFEKFQSILTHNIKDFEYFKMKNGHYLAASNYGTLLGYGTDQNNKKVPIIDHQVDSIIYWWTGKLFIEYQRIPTNGAIRIQSFNVDEDVALVVSNSKAQAIVYIYDFYRGIFKPAETQGLQPFPGESSVPDVRSVRAYKWQGKTYLTVANYNSSRPGGYNVFRVNFTTVPSEKITPGLREIVTSTLDSMGRQLNILKSDLDRFENQSKRLMLTDNHQTITGKMKFRRADFNGILNVKELKYEHKLENNPIEKAVEQSMKLRQKLSQLQNEVNAIQKEVDKSVYLRGNYTVQGEVTFTDNAKFKNNVSSRSVEISGLIDGTNLTDVHKRAWNKDEDQNITGSYMFNDTVFMRENLNVSGKINDLYIPEDIVLNNTDQVITGNKTFLSNVTLLGNMSTENYTINKLSLSEDVMLRRKPQTVSGAKYFQGTVSFNGSVNVLGLIDSVNFSDYVRRAGRISRNQTFTGNLTFSNGFKVTDNINVEGTIDGVNLTELALDVVRVDVDQVIGGNKTFLSPVTMNGGAVTNSTVNGHFLQDIMTMHTPQNITSTKEFEEVYVKGNITTYSTIDGIDLSEQAVTLDGNQTITGAKTFYTNVMTEGNVTVSGLVDNVDLSEWKRRAVSLSRPQSIPSAKNFTGQIIIEKHFNISDRINGINLKEFRGSIVTKDNYQTIEKPVVFKALNFKSDLNVTGRVNNVRIPEDLVPISEEVTVNGSKTFQDDITLQKGMNIGEKKTINEEVLSDFLASVVYNGTDQVIGGDKVFLSYVHFKKNLIVKGKVNNLTIPADVVLLDRTQNITGNKTFQSEIKIDKNVITTIVYVNKTVNGVDVSELAAETLNKNQNQTIIGNIYLHKNSTVTKNLTVKGQVNGVDIETLAKSIARISRDQTISGNKVFTESMHCKGKVTSPGKVNDIDIANLDQSLVKTNKKQVVSGTKVFLKSADIGGNVKNGTMNGIKFDEFRAATVHTHEDSIIKGKLTFNDNVNFHTLKINGSADGVDMTNDVLKTSGNQLIKGEKIVYGDVTSKEIVVSGKVDGVDISELDRTSMRVYGNQKLTGRLFFRDGINVTKDMDVDGTVNNVNISALKRESVYKDGFETITGYKEFFGNVTFENDVWFHENVDGVNLTYMFLDALRKDGNEIITAKKIFANESGVVIARQILAGNLSVLEYIDGVNLTDFSQRVMRVSRNQVITGKLSFFNRTLFKTDVNINGFLNNINVSDIMTISDDQVIKGYKSFQNVTFSSNVNLTGSVDGFDLSEFAQRRVTLSGDQSIRGQNVFQKEVIFKGNVSMKNNKTINGIDVGNEILSLDDDNNVTGHKNFTIGFHVSNNLDVKKQVSGVDLRDLSSRAVRIYGPKSLYRANEMLQNFTVLGDITVAGLVNGVTIRGVANFSDEFSATTHQTLKALNCSIYDIDQEIRELSGFLESEVFLRGFESLQLNYTGRYGKAAARSVDGDVYIGVAGNRGQCENAKVFRCDAQLTKCSVHQTILTTSDRLQFFKNDLVVGNHHDNGSNSCPSTARILKWNAKTLIFDRVETVTVKILQDFLFSNETILRADLRSIYPTSIVPYINTEISAVTYGTTEHRSSPSCVAFKSEEELYILTPSSLLDTNYLELFKLNIDKLVLSKLQAVSTDRVIDLDVANIRGHITAAIAEKTKNSNHIRIFSVSKGKLYFLQYLEIQATSVQIVKIGHHWYLTFAAYGHGYGLCKWQGAAGFGSCRSASNIYAKYVTVFHHQCNAYAVITQETGWELHKIILEGLPKTRRPSGDCYIS